MLVGVEAGTVPLGRAARKRLSPDGVVWRRSLAASEVVGAEVANRTKIRPQVIMNVKRGIDRYITNRKLEIEE